MFISKLPSGITLDQFTRKVIRDYLERRKYGQGFMEPLGIGWRKALIPHLVDHQRDHDLRKIRENGQ